MHEPQLDCNVSDLMFLNRLVLLRNKLNIAIVYPPRHNLPPVDLQTTCSTRRPRKSEKKTGVEMFECPPKRITHEDTPRLNISKSERRRLHQGPFKLDLAAFTVVAIYLPAQVTPEATQWWKATADRNQEFLVRRL